MMAKVFLYRVTSNHRFETVRILNRACLDGAAVNILLDVTWFWVLGFSKSIRYKDFFAIG
jgi:hypothetical protein